jgi:hypothetical protein
MVRLAIIYTSTLCPNRAYASATPPAPAPMTSECLSGTLGSNMFVRNALFWYVCQEYLVLIHFSGMLGPDMSVRSALFWYVCQEYLVQICLLGMLGPDCLSGMLGSDMSVRNAGSWFVSQEYLVLIHLSRMLGSDMSVRNAQLYAPTYMTLKVLTSQ